LTEFRLLSRFERTFRNGPYRHRNSQLGNRIADCLFDDLFELSTSSRLRRDVSDGVVALNPRGLSPGLKARRGDGSFGPIVPGRTARLAPDHPVPRGPTAEVDIGAEVKILAKSMIKQIDRVISDLCGQAGHFKKKSPDALTVGIVGLNLAHEYVSLEGRRRYVTGKDGPHPVEEAPEAERRLIASAEPCYREFLILPFRATNRRPFDFEWVGRQRIEDEYGSLLARLLRAYDRRRS